MRKETSAGIIAGLVSGLLIGVVFGADAAWSTWAIESSMRNPITNMTMTQMSYIGTLIYALFVFVIGLSICVCLGSLVGFIFAVVVNRIPTRSTYAKAIMISVTMWLIFTISSLPRTYYWSQSTGNQIEWSWSWSSLAFFPLFVFDGVIFAYLFNRWTKA